MALIAPQSPASASGLLSPVYATANASDTFAPGNNVLLYVKNSNAATRTITITTPPSYRGLAVPDPVNTIPATTGELVFGPFPPELYGDPVTGLVTVTPSAAAGVSYAVIQLQVP